MHKITSALRNLLPHSNYATPTLAVQARLYVGQSELPGNAGWFDADFQAAMVKAGWRKGQSWCAYFVRLCVRMAGYVDKTSPSAVTTYRNYAKVGMVGSEPRPDSIACWQRYKDGAATILGHVGIVGRVSTLENGEVVFECIEGNTDGSGGREGDGVYAKTRRASLKRVANGLVLLGFCYPPRVAA